MAMRIDPIHDARTTCPMVKRSSRYRPWTDEEKRELRRLAADHAPSQIGRRLDRTESAIRNQAQLLGVSLRQARQA
jgi:hypothetical protein